MSENVSSNKGAEIHDSWLSANGGYRLPNDTLEKAIKALGLDRNAPCPHKPDQTIEATLRDDLSKIVRRWGQPGATESGTTLSKQKTHAEAIKSKLDTTLNALRAMTYEQLFVQEANNLEFLVAHRFREASAILKNPIPPLPNLPGSHLIIEAYKESGEWRQRYPFDGYLADAICAIEALSEAASHALKSIEEETTSRGMDKQRKYTENDLLYALCMVYKRYTGEIPTSYPKEDGTADGKIIQFLRLVLSETGYKKETTDWALEKRIRELRKKREYARFFQPDDKS